MNIVTPPALLPLQNFPAMVYIRVEAFVYGGVNSFVNHRSGLEASENGKA
jgi:hypothetical protein